MKIIREFVPYLIMIAVVILIRTYLFAPIRVNGDSMKPTLIDQEIMILNKISAINRFDIVVIKEDTSYLIKRVIGLPNDKITYQNNKLIINGKVVEDSHLGKHIIEDFSISLEKNEYFVLGDNRSNSYDSRIFGPVLKKDILGTTSLVLFPFNRIGLVN